MKNLIFILTICFLCLCFSSNAQIKTEHEKVRYYPGPSVTKGYYAIGKNGEKQSSHSSGIRLTTSESYPVVQKGYYSIGNNNRKLGKQIIATGATQSEKTVVPVIKKGYYSIGRNSEKLK